MNRCYAFCAQRSWFPAFLGFVLLLLASGVVYLYAMMLQITSSAERFEGIPCYVIGTLLLCSGVFLIILAKPSFQENILMIRSSAALFAITLLLCTIAIVMTLWLADKQDKYSICVFQSNDQMCLCRRDNQTDSDHGWIVYHRVDSCVSLDSLFHLMVVVVTLYSVSSFLCFLAIVCLCFLWRHSRELTLRALSDNSQMLGHASRHVNVPLSDWDSWLFAYPWFRRFFSDGTRSPGLPPTYEQSEQHQQHRLQSHHSDRLTAVEGVIDHYSGGGTQNMRNYGNFRHDRDSRGHRNDHSNTGDASYSVSEVAVGRHADNINMNAVSAANITSSSRGVAPPISSSHRVRAAYLHPPRPQELRLQQVFTNSPSSHLINSQNIAAMNYDNLASTSSAPIPAASGSALLGITSNDRWNSSSGDNIATSSTADNGRSRRLIFSLQRHRPSRQQRSSSVGNSHRGVGLPAVAPSYERHSTATGDLIYRNDHDRNSSAYARNPIPYLNPNSPSYYRSQPIYSSNSLLIPSHGNGRSPIGSATGDYPPLPTYAFASTASPTAPPNRNMTESPLDLSAINGRQSMESASNGFNLSSILHQMRPLVSNNILTAGVAWAVSYTSLAMDRSGAGSNTQNDGTTNGSNSGANPVSVPVEGIAGILSDTNSPSIVSPTSRAGPLHHDARFSNGRYASATTEVGLRYSGTPSPPSSTLVLNGPPPPYRRTPPASSTGSVRTGASSAFSRVANRLRASWRSTATNSADPIKDIDL